METTSTGAELTKAKPGGSARLGRWLPLLGVALFLTALAILEHELRSYRFSDIVAEFRQIGPADLVFALLAALLSYLLQTTYDLMGLRYVGAKVPYRRVGLASFTGIALSNNVGHSLFTGASVRLRLYAGTGLGALQITTLNTFCTVTVWLGFFALAGGALVVEPVALPAGVHAPLVGPALGLVFLLIVLAYVAAVILRRRSLTVRGITVSLPSPRLALLQIPTAALDWGLCALALYLLLPAPTPFSFARFLAVFLLAQVAGLASQVPGGLGVFEAVMLLNLSSIMPATKILGSLIAFRIVYYLLPLAVAALMLAVFELWQRREALSRASRFVGEIIPPLAPAFLAVTTFAGGVILLLSGATPAAHGRLALLRDLLPLPVIELSHFLGSLTGFALLLLAWAIFRRIDAAWGITVLLLTAGAVLSLVKGFDYEEALILTVFLAALLPSRHYFYRRASLLTEPLRPGWLIATGAVVIGTLWLALFSFKHVEYSHDLFWQFAFHAQAPRVLRAAVGVLVFASAFGLVRLLRPAKPRREHWTVPADDPVRTIVAASPESNANLVFLADKAVLLNERNNAFIMYAVSGGSWVAMGDPVGPQDEHADLIWRFREVSHGKGGRTVFYEVGKENLHLYLDVGLTVLKLGEEAIVPLSTLSIEGRENKELRYMARRLERDGATFEIVERGRVCELLPELEEISDAWLEHKNTREKGFSLGLFDPAYLQEFPLALVRQADRILAFANLWRGAGDELSIDLMRHRPEAPNGVMDFLFVQIMLWGKAQGFARFNLGMVPLKGLQNRALAPFWQRLGAMVFLYGEHFYNFQGLRQFKEKFNPVWEPRYLASPGGIVLPRVMADVAALVSRGLKGVISK